MESTTERKMSVLMSFCLVDRYEFDRIHHQLNKFIRKTMKELIHSKQNVKKVFQQKRHEFYMDLIFKQNMGQPNTDPSFLKAVEEKIKVKGIFSISFVSKDYLV